MIRSRDYRHLHGYKLQEGPLAGTRIVVVRIEALAAIAEAGGVDAKSAALELERRGTAKAEVKITNHAIDRASTHCRRIWLGTRRQDEGLFTWLQRVTQAALVHGEDVAAEKINYAGMTFTIQIDRNEPVLVTIHHEGSVGSALKAARAALRELEGGELIGVEVQELDSAA